MKWLGKINQRFFGQVFLVITCLLVFLFTKSTSVQAVSFWLCSNSGWTGKAGWIRTGEYPDGTPEEISKAAADCNRKAHEGGFQNNCIIASSNTPPNEVCQEKPKNVYHVSCCKQNKDGVNTGVINENVEASSPQMAIAEVQSKYPFIGSCSTDKVKTNDECSGLGLPKPEPKPSDKIRITDPGIVGHILSSMNPLGSAKICSDGQLTIGCILSYIVNKIIFPLSTIFLLLMIIWGGYKIVSGSMAGAQNAVQAGKQRLIGAILGFILLASVYWIWQLIEATTKIHIMKKWW